MRANTNRSRRGLVMVIAAIALIASACGSDDASETEAGSPIAEFLGQDDFLDFESDPEAAQAQYAEEERVREEAIADCMQAQGFEYVPRDSSDFIDFVEADGIDYDSREYAEKYGFGITTQRFSQKEVGPELVGHTYDDVDDSFGEDSIDQDPNNAIVENMDDATRQAYYEALYGPEDDFPAYDPETMSDEELEALDEEFMLWEPRGCEGEAWNDGDQGLANQFYQDFSKELQVMYESIQDDPRIKAKEDEISTCVADKGFEFTSFDDDLWQRFEPDLNKIEEMLGGFPGENLTEEQFNSMTEQELDELLNQPREFTAEAKTLLGELQATEIGIAVAVWDCDGSFSANDELYREVTIEYERQFLADNADRLTDYKAEE